MKRPAKIALITGAAGGIGRACALALGRAGYRTIGLDVARRAPRGLDRYLVCDVSDPEATRRAVREALGANARLDLLVACAGIVRDAAIAAMTDEDITRLVGVNVLGVVNSVRAALPALRRARGAIVTISSAQAHRPSPGLAIYAATKGAVESLTKALAVELAPTVRANAISPGLIKTPILLAQQGVDRRTYDAYVRRRGQGYLMKRIGEADEIAAAVLYLASPAAAWITGAILPVDGGKSVGGG